MNAKTYNKFKNLLIKACDKHVSDGKKIISGGFYRSGIDGGYCPIGCVVLSEVINPDRVDYFEAMNKKLKMKVPEKQYWDFINGFDNHSDNNSAGTQLFKLGRALRKKYLDKLNK